MIIEEELVENTFKIVNLFFKHFGDNGTRSYKFAAVVDLLIPDVHIRKQGEEYTSQVESSDISLMF